MDTRGSLEFRTFVERRDYRSIAIELVKLEDERGIVSMAELGDDPEAAVLGSPELSLEYDTAPRAGCSVYGYYHFRLDAPATIFVHQSITAARDSFTIVHEYGHHVQRQHGDWANIRYSMPAGVGSKLEERVADAFAAEILIPSDSVPFGSSWLSARLLAEVHQRVVASRSAVAMRAVEIAPSNDSGTVVICDGRGVVVFARAAGDDVFTPTRGVAQPGLAALFGAAYESGGHARREISEGIQAVSGWVQEDVVGDAAIDNTGEYAFVVLRSTQLYGRKPVWEQREAECASPACELVFAVDASIAICELCGDPRCPDCSTCSCEPPSAAACNECFMTYSLAEQFGQIEHVCL